MKSFFLIRKCFSQITNPYVKLVLFPYERFSYMICLF